MAPAGPPRTLAPDRVFAYGTLMSGYPRRPLLGPAVFEARGRIRGALFHFGEYPGVVLDDSGWVWGELYRVPDLAVRIRRLDREEWYDPHDESKSLFLRRAVLVELDGGVRHEAWVYEFNRAHGEPSARGPRIASGDWRAHLAARDPAAC